MSPGPGLSLQSGHRVAAVPAIGLVDRLEKGPQMSVHQSSGWHGQHGPGPTHCGYPPEEQLPPEDQPAAIGSPTHPDDRGSAGIGATPPRALNGEPPNGETPNGSRTPHPGQPHFAARPVPGPAMPPNPAMPPGPAMAPGPVMPPGQPMHPGQARPHQPRRPDYASWGRRAAAWLIDHVPSLIASTLFLVWYVTVIIELLKVSAAAMGMIDVPTEVFVDSVGWLIAAGVVYLIALACNLVNRWYLGGRTGQSVGRRLLRITLIAAETGRPLGVGRAFVRDLAHIADGFFYVGYLWPLWDDQRRTFADMMMKSIVINAPSGQQSRGPG